VGPVLWVLKTKKNQNSKGDPSEDKNSIKQTCLYVHHSLNHLNIPKSRE
jgi:hypothetical protein